MNKFFIIKLVFKNLMARKMRTILTIAGVAISIGFITFLVSFGLGLQRVSTAQITNLEALQILDVTVGKSNLVTIGGGKLICLVIGTSGSSENIPSFGFDIANIEQVEFRVV